MKNVTTSPNIVPARLQLNAEHMLRAIITFFLAFPHFTSVGEHLQRHRQIAHAPLHHAYAELYIPGFAGVLSYLHHLDRQFVSSQPGSLHSVAAR